MNKEATYLLTAVIFLSGLSLVAGAQQITETQTNEYGLTVISSEKAYRQLVKTDSNQSLVLLGKYISHPATAFFYATTNNFTHQILYRNPLPYLRLPAAKALKNVQDSLQKTGLGICIFDAYRPYEVTRKMWAYVPDERYAANPAKGSGHNRGIAVDLTLIDLNSRTPLPMPTAFDNFSDTAHYTFTQLPENVLKNRMLLRSVMEYFGFVALETEWWHFSLPDPKKFPLLNLDFDVVKRILGSAVEPTPH